jgi:hypothetical protein
LLEKAVDFAVLQPFHSSLLLLLLLQVDSLTTFHLLWPDEPSPAQQQQGQQQGQQAGAAQQLQEQLVAAAQKAVQGSSQEAAVGAAQRAWQCGLASGTLDLSTLGGIDGHLAALRELVTAPLR